MRLPAKRFRIAVPAVLLAAWVSAAAADGLSPAATNLFGFTPKVPISALAAPAGWFDPSRFHMSTSVTVGGGSGFGTQGLQVTSFSYQFHAPVWMSVNVGNAFGSSFKGSSGMFLEGLDVGMRPTSNFLIQVRYRNVRSPMQYDSYSPFRPYGW